MTPRAWLAYTVTCVTDDVYVVFALRDEASGAIEAVEWQASQGTRPSTWIAPLEKHCEVSPTPSSPIVQWAVRHCRWSATRYTILEDELAPFRTRRGRYFGGAIA